MSHPPPPASGQVPPPGYSPQGPPKKRKPLLWILAGVAALGLLCCGGVAVITVAGGGDDETASPPASAPESPKQAPQKNAPKKPEGPGLGQPARDGKFEFVVHSAKCGRTKVGNQYLNEKAQGVFCEVSVTVKNIGDEAQTFSGSSQKGLDAKGTEFSNDTGAEMYANEGSPTFLEEINPGNQVKGVLIFDVPKGTKLVAVELHDSPFSGGVKVRLS